MPSWVIQIDGWDPVAVAAVSICAASEDDDRICHLNAQTWWPAIARLPVLSYDFFSGDLDAGRIETPSGAFVLSVDPFPNLPRYALGGARFRLWSGNPGDAWASWTLRFDGVVVSQPAVSDGLARIDFRVDDRWADSPLLSTFAGTGAGEGPAELTGNAKPMALGAPRFAGGTTVNVTDNIIQLHGYGAIQDVEVAFEAGARFAASSGDYANYAALQAATIAAGGWATSKAAGLVRFGAPPAGRLSFHVQGDAASGWVRKPGAIINRIAALSGGTGKIATSTLTALDTARPWNVSLALTEQVTARELIQRVSASVNAVAGISWTGKLWVQPVGIGSPTITLAADGSALPPVARVEQLGIAAPFWRLAIEAEPTWQVHGESEVAFVDGGLAGADGFSTAVVYLYQRAATAPSLPSATVTYNFSTTVATGVDNGWDQTIPAADGNPVWVTTAIAAATAATDTIAAAEWAAAAILAQDGTETVGLDLAASHQTFKYDASGTVAAQTITFKAMRQNTTVQTAWTVRDRSGTVIVSGNATAVAASGYFTRVDDDTLTMTHTSYGSFISGAPARETFTLEAKVIDGVTVIKQVSVSKLADGANAKGVTLTGSSAFFPYDAAGSPISQTVTFKAVRQNTTVQTLWTVRDRAGGSIGPSTAAALVTATSGAFTRVDDDTLTMTHTQWAAWIAGGAVRETTTLEASITDGVTVVDSVTIQKADAAGVYPELTNSADTVAADAAGTVASFAGLGGTFKLKAGGTTPITSGITFSVFSETGVDVSIDAAGVYTVNSMSADTGIAVLRATYAGKTFDQNYTIAKSKQGTAGAPGSPGSPGSPGAPGAIGVSTRMVFLRSATAPSTPSASAGTPAGWYDTTTAVPAAANPMWSTTGERPLGGGNYVWGAPVRVEAVSSSASGQFVNLAFGVSAVMQFSLAPGSSKIISGTGDLPSPTGPGTASVQIEWQVVGGGWTASNGPVENYNSGEPVYAEHSVTVTNSGGTVQSYQTRGSIVRSNTNSGLQRASTSLLRI